MAKPLMRWYDGPQAKASCWLCCGANMLRDELGWDRTTDIALTSRGGRKTAHVHFLLIQLACGLLQADFVRTRWHHRKVRHGPVSLKRRNISYADAFRSLQGSVLRCHRPNIELLPGRFSPCMLILSKNFSSAW